MKITLILAAAVGAATLAVGQAGGPGTFMRHARFRGIGGCLNTVVGPGPEAGTERVYASHIYTGQALDIVAVDPLTGRCEVFESPIPSECGAWALAVGPDGQVYVGTLPSAHVLRLDWAQRKLVDMGRPSDTEQYIWQLALGTDGKLYGCTYPSAKLVRFDPATGRGEDLGRMDPTELYARSVAADDRGFVYVAIGMSTRHVVAYEIATGEHRDITPEELAGPGSATVNLGDDGKVYAYVGDKHLRLDGWTAEIIPADQHRTMPPLHLSDGRLVSYGGRTITLRDPESGETTTHPTGYEGKSQSFFRIGLGPDGQLYGSTAMPIHFVRADPDSDAWEELGQPGGGEFYSFLAYGADLIGAAYSGHAPLMIYHPGRPWGPAEKPDGNPWLIHYPGENSGWRPMAIVPGKDDKVYIGAVSGYGLLGGPLCVFDPDTGHVDQYLHLVPDESVVALAVLPDGTIAGGTTVGGGGGSHPTQTEAKLFLFDPGTREKTFETTPVPGRAAIDALAVGRDGLVYGFAGDTMFVFNAKGRQVQETSRHELGTVIYNALAPGADGELYGVANGGIFTIDTATRRAKVLATYPGGISGGFAIIGRRIYFTSGPEIVSYTLP
jgi:hypothetical protein